MKDILVTGGAGFIGSHFVRYALSHGGNLRIANLDALTYAGSLDNLRDLPDAERHHFIEGDICDGELVRELLREYDIDTIVHFAAETHVDRSIQEPAPFLRTNVTGTMTLLEAARAWQGRRSPGEPFRFHHISTDEVYGSLAPDEPPWDERAPYAPNSPYAATKASSDHLVRAYGHTYGVPYTITNCSNNYGPYQFPEKLIPRVVLNARMGKHLPVYGDGQQIRDWLYVEDHCQAIWKVLEEGEEGEMYNLGGNVQIPNLAVVETVCDLLDQFLPDSPHLPHRDLIRMVEDRPGHDRRYAMDFSKIQQELGWEPGTPLEAGLRKTVRWYLAHPSWVEEVLGRSR